MYYSEILERPGYNFKGGRIGDNCIIGAGSFVAKDIPSNSVAVGVPCKVVCSVKDYFNKRIKDGLEEAKEYITEFRKVYHRDPELSKELREEWIYFVESSNMDKYPQIPVKQRTGKAYDNWLKYYKSPFHSYEEFKESIK